MCFRPPNAGKAIKCPNCGSLNPGMANNCIKCKADLAEAKAEAEAKKESNSEQ